MAEEAPHIAALRQQPPEAGSHRSQLACALHWLHNTLICEQSTIHTVRVRQSVAPLLKFSTLEPLHIQRAHPMTAASVPLYDNIRVTLW